MASCRESSTIEERTKPYGIQLLEFIRRRVLSFRTHQFIVFALTFFAYASYHITRKIMSIVKSELSSDSTSIGISHWHRAIFLQSSTRDQRTPSPKTGWAPFNSADGTVMLGEIDVAFLSVYAFGMYFTGHLGDCLDLRVLLTFGMLGTGFFTVLFGVGYWLKIHNFYYYLIIQMLAGLFQSTGWPSVVAVLGNWFGKSKRGLIMGIWNAHTSFGNITGSLIASALLSFGWGWSFAVPGILIAFVGITVFLLLPASPEAVGVEKEDCDLINSSGKTNLSEPFLNVGSSSKEKSVGFFEAWKIPGVAPYAICLFFCKLVAYTFLYWLPFYISHTAVDGKFLSDSTAGTLSTLFDVGGVVGGILAGHISDCLNARALTAASFTYCAIPALFLYRIYGNISLVWNIILMFITGIFVNGPYALITTAVAADLGTHISLNGNSRALATVTAIIDGTGSVGAAIGPLLTGYISAKSWNGVFMMLMGAALMAGLLLTRLVVAEVSSKMEASRRTEPTSSREEV